MGSGAVLPGHFLKASSRRLCATSNQVAFWDYKAQGNFAVGKGHRLLVHRRCWDFFLSSTSSLPGVQQPPLFFFFLLLSYLELECNTEPADKSA